MQYTIKKYKTVIWFVIFYSKYRISSLWVANLNELTELVS